MALTRIIMPKTGADMEEGRILTWKKKEGERVAKGEILLEIETDKATMEVESPEAGVILKLLCAEGDTAPATDLIAILGEGNEPAEEIARVTSATREAAPPQQASATEPPQAAAPSSTTRDSAKVKASPLARRLAQEMGIDLGAIRGTGPDGRIEKDDVLKAAETKKAPAQASEEVVALSPMRRAIARHVSRSKQEIPDFSVTMAMDMTATLRKKRELQQAAQDVSINDLLIFAVSRVLPSHPNLNAEFNGDSLLLHHDVNIGFAVGTDDGLYIPVVRYAGIMTIEDIARETQRLSAKVEQKQITEEEMARGTFTISSLGMFGVDSFTAIISPPQTAILSVGRVVEQPVHGDDGALTWRPEMAATITVDHRAIDGLTAARFMASLRDFLKSL